MGEKIWQSLKANVYVVAGQLQNTEKMMLLLASVGNQLGCVQLKKDFMQQVFLKFVNHARSSSGIGGY